MTDAPLDPRSELIVKLGRNPRLAHAVLFGHRHPNTTPDFHNEIIDLWHSDAPKVLIKAFRGAAKSTRAEEAIIIRACLRQFKNCIVLGETYERAVERLRAIKNEFDTNAYLEDLFGNLVGDTWSEGRIVLANGVAIQAFGRGQSLRGSKHLDWRPDLAFGDDIENEESVATPEAIEKCMRWLMSVVMPALDPNALVRINGTPLSPQAVIEQLEAVVTPEGEKDWESRTYPIRSINAETGELQATWPDRFSLAWITAKEAEYARLGLHNNFAQEYLCKAEDMSQKPFTVDLMRVEPMVRTWQAVYAMYDPARTVKSTSASTGIAIWSWLNNRLIVWDAYVGMWKPDEIIADMFRVDDLYRPIVIGVEEDGLHEFILQPLRQEQLRRAYAIPIRPLKAPKGKLDFIRGLQPFFKAKEVTFAKDCPEAVAQFLGFPTGRIDVPNALAYALRLRPGQPIYDGFTVQNITEDLGLVQRQSVYLVVNATTLCTTAALVQVIDGGLHVIDDWVREGDPGQGLGGICKAAGAAASGHKVRVFAGPQHFSQHDTVGLRAAARKIPVDVGQGQAPHIGREEIRLLTRRLTRGFPALRVSTQARWVLNAFAGGYAQEVTKHGVLSEFAVEGPYRTLMEGIESFAALLKSSSIRDDEPVHYATTPDGRRYISSLGNRQSTVQERKIG